MDIDKAIKQNIFPTEILKNKQGVSEEGIIKDKFFEDPLLVDFDDKKNDFEQSEDSKIKEESLDLWEGNQYESSSEEGVGCSYKIITHDGLLKEEELGETLPKEEIKEEFVEDQTPLPDENQDTFTYIDDNSEVNASTEQGVQNCLEKKIDSPPSNVIYERSHEEKKIFVEKQFKCGFCPYQATQRTSFQKHERSHRGERHLKCSTCSYRAANKWRLQRHERYHTGEKPYKCNSCPYQAAERGTLQRHERTHTGEKPFKCSFCPYQASEPGSLRIHKRTHTGEKPFKCNFCPYQSVQMGNVQKHERTHTCEKPFKCRYCPYQAKDGWSLRRHERTHTGEKPFKCSSCSYQAAQISHLKKHERTHTGEKVQM